MIKKKLIVIIFLLENFLTKKSTVTKIKKKIKNKIFITMFTILC